MRKGPEPGKRKRDREASEAGRLSSSSPSVPSSIPSVPSTAPISAPSAWSALSLPPNQTGLDNGSAFTTSADDALTHLFGEHGFGFDIGTWFLPPLSLAAHGIPDTAPPPSTSNKLLDGPTLSAVLDLVPTFYSRNVYIVTLLPYAYIDARTHRGDHDSAPDFAALLVAMAANVLLHTVEAREAFEGTRVIRARELLDLACRLKGTAGCGAAVGIDAVLSSFLLFLCFFGLGDYDAGWFRLRESLTLAECMVTQQERAIGTPDEIDDEERMRRTRLIGLLTVCERAYSLKRHRPSTEWRDAALKRGAADPQAPHERAVRGLSLLLRVFSLIDTRVINCWNAVPGHEPGSCGLTRETLVQLQHDLDNVFGPNGEDVALNPPDPSRALTEGQRADLLMNQKWLKNRVFELSVAHGFVHPLKDQGEEPAWELSPLYAIALGNTTLAMYRGLSPRGAEYNGLMWCEKLWHIGRTIVEMAEMDASVLDAPVSGPEMTMTGRETLAQLLAQITLFRAGQNPYIQRLADDIARVM
ncbi:hypothetical protein CC85DRAFT_284173 [Cutaneotrichosporon oleaginosum]|uniref:Transcription factor domain-containing protein n=1 Tax=Cutaneotrichosporon oleaginosum TaxID=879819 RepID=A0A0J0XS46_9TREE|nr:uncharacterized protein CC85DRAFT_284173 [Cutaneotrichosporon oleaginosum]KLT43892.1 hypothetical protein CC85DRAFT_284173 [Cutaneotrichosporon oleaginosum]TXT06368.1 hypothetical protein COLE_05699 [Cutaneotrichosporon oleaginosum]